jgi:hypothetical protein
MFLFVLIFFMIILISFNLIKMIYLKYSLKKEIDKLSNFKSLKLSRINNRNLEKDVKAYSFKFSEKKFKKFKISCEKNEVTMVSCLDDFITNYIQSKESKK